MGLGRRDDVGTLEVGNFKDKEELGVIEMGGI